MSQNATMLKNKSSILKLYSENENYLFCLDILSAELNMNEKEIIDVINSMIAESELDKHLILRSLVGWIHKFKNSRGFQNFPNNSETVRIIRSYLSCIYGNQSKIVKYSHKTNITKILREFEDWNNHLELNKGGRPTEESRDFANFSNYKLEKFIKSSSFKKSKDSDISKVDESNVQEKLLEILKYLEGKKTKNRNELREFAEYLLSELKFIQLDDSYIDERVDSWLESKL